MSGINEHLHDRAIKQTCHTTRIKCNFYGDSRITSSLVSFRFEVLGGGCKEQYLLKCVGVSCGIISYQILLRHIAEDSIRL